MAQFLRIMAARGHALLVEGRLDRSELAAYARDQQSSLASDLANCFAGSEVADAWTALAAKDLENVEMIAESEFKETLSLRMKQLSIETRRLCGLSVILENNNESVVVNVIEQQPIDLFTYNETSEVNDELWEQNMLKIVELKNYKKKKGKSVPVEGQIAFKF